MALLERRQARRRGETVLAPIEISVGGLDALADGSLRRVVNPEFRRADPIFPEKSEAELIEPGG